MQSALQARQGSPRRRLSFRAGNTRLRAWDRILVGATPMPSDLADNLVTLNKSLLDDGTHLDYGRSTPESAALLETVLGAATAHLATLVHEVRPSESYERRDVLGGAYVDFHNDEGFGDPGVLFCVTSVHCPGDLVFPNLRLRVPFGPGTVVIFDPLEPHGITQPGRNEAGTTEALVLSVDLQLDTAACLALGLTDIEGLEPFEEFDLNPAGHYRALPATRRSGGTLDANLRSPVSAQP